ncbi:MAG: MFS transporter [Pseudomonadota bacterium]
MLRFTHNGGKTSYLVLLLCQILWMAVNTTVLSYLTLSAQYILSSSLTATVPHALMNLSAAVLSAPAMYIFLKIGWKPGFLMGALIGVVGCLLLLMGVIFLNIYVFTAGIMGWGVCVASGQYYKFFVRKIFHEKDIGRGVGVLLSAGIVGIVVGPLGTRLVGGDLVSSAYETAFLIVLAYSLLHAISCAVLIGVDRNLKFEQSIGERSANGNSNRINLVTRGRILTSENVALLGSISAFGIMVYMMASAPLAMVACGITTVVVASVIQWHLVGMYVPAVVAGFITDKVGPEPTLIFGILIMIAGCLVSLIGTAEIHFYLCLFLIGVGWSLAIVGATTILSNIKDEIRRARYMATSETGIHVTVTFAAIFAGPGMTYLGWESGNIIMLLLCVVLTFLLLYARKRFRELTVERG